MRRVEAADYRDLVRVSDPQIAPDGESVAFVRTVPVDDATSESTVYRVPVGGDEAAPFTAAAGEDAEPRFSLDGDRLAFASTRGDRDEPQLWVLPTGGGEARRVTDVPGGVSSLAWSPDGSRIAFCQRSTAAEREAGVDLDRAGPDGDREEVYEREDPDPRGIDRGVYRADEHYFDGTRSHVYLADLDGGVERLTDGEADAVVPAWGDASTLYYAVERGDDTVVHDVVAHDLAADDPEPVAEAAAWTVALAATADGRVAFPYASPDRATLEQTDVRVYDRERDRTAVPTAALDRTVAVDVGIEWGPAGEDLYLPTPDEGDVALRRVRPGGEIETVVGDGHLDGFSVGDDAVAFTRSEWDHPGDVFAATRGGAETNRLTRINADYLDDRAVSQPEEVRFESGDGTAEVQGWVLTPPDFDTNASYPLAVEIHGGPHAMWTTAGTMWHEFQTLAARGYVVFWCNPRGSTGYGEDFMAAIEDDWGDATAADVLAGVDRVTERAAVDGDRTVVTGGSFGGYATAWLIGHTDRFAAAVAQRGVYDLIGFYGATDRAFMLVEWDFETTPLEEPARLWKRSPVSRAGEVSTPTLLLHSEDDYRVPINDAELFYRLLWKADVETRLVRYPREGHELSRSGEPGHVVDRLERIVRWFDDHLDGDGDGNGD